jgi:rSAM/selenodomain-associated transferase 2
MTLSVVIPAWNEQGRVAAAVASVRGEAEVLVVDGGSTDATAAEAVAAGARVLECPRGRGRQLDLGARRAEGEWLVFLHADTRLEAGWAGALRGLGSDVVGGAFRFAVDAPSAAYRALETAVALRCRLLSLPYGDQALFARREAYLRAGGFPPFPLMEDVAFVRRLARLGRLAFPRARAFTSPRRWQRAGIIETTARNAWLLTLYALGWPPEELARRYAGEGRLEIQRHEGPDAPGGRNACRATTSPRTSPASRR